MSKTNTTSDSKRSRSLKRFAFATAGTFAIALASAVPASAYSTVGATWTNPTGSRTLYFMASSFTANEESIISNLNMAYDSSNTNLVDPLDPGSSTLNISGTLAATSTTVYNYGTFKLYRYTTNWPFSVVAPGLTCRITCLQTSSDAGANKATVYLDDFDYNFGTLFSGTSVDFSTVLLHELGHAHGLAHPSAPLTSAETAAVMNPNNKIKRTLTNDDILGLEVLY